ncbi:MAG: NAD-dependent protein deacylase [Oscillospiraceae bacterium]|nr:NAD-dependent protein deacylase [Oscillospiraceae bacterium]
MQEKIEKLQQIIDSSRNVVFFGGAGVSTESGIPDFRSVDGLYNQKYKFQPETILSHNFFFNNMEDFYEFYRDKMLALDAQPNAAHKWLAELEKKGRLDAIVTQNIDGLHQAAGSRRVYELHGSVHTNRCLSCGQFYTAESILKSTGIPRCSCGGFIKPKVVLYDENLDMDLYNRAIKAISYADTMIIAGTSLTVYPAAGLIRYFNGPNLVLINRDTTPMDSKADLVIHGSVGQVLSQIEIR